MPRKKSLLKKPSGQIRVLLVDDDEMARNAWKKVLSKSSQTQVVGEATPRELVRNSGHIPAPEIIVAGFSFVEKGLIRSTKLIKAWGNFPKIIVICENKEQVKAAYSVHADWAATSPFNDQDLVTWIRALSDDAKRLCSEYLSKLSATDRGSSQQQGFTILIQGMLQLLFHPDLVNPEKMDVYGQPRSTPQGRLIFRNQANKDNAGGNGGSGTSKFDEFWEDIRQNHGAKYVSVDVYNSEIAPSAIQALGRYLTNLHGSFGLIVGRVIEKNRLHPLTVALFENEKKAILLLGDAELQEMLEYKAGGVNPACLLKDLYQNLVAEADS